MQNALTVYYQEVIGNLISTLISQISSTQRLPKLDQSVPLVLSGGTVMPAGFLDHFATVLKSKELPLRLSDVKVSADPLNATARGALMACALLSGRKRRTARRADRIANSPAMRRMPIR